MTNVTALPVGAKVDPVARARAVGPAVAAVADEIERSQQIPEPVLGQLHESRIYRMLLPRSAGGDHLDPWASFPPVQGISLFHDPPPLHPFAPHPTPCTAPPHPF